MCRPCGSLRLLRVYGSTRVIRAVVGAYYACIIAHTYSGSVRAVVVIEALVF